MGAQRLKHLLLWYPSLIDDDFAEPLPRRSLKLQGLLDLRLGNEPLRNQQLTERRFISIVERVVFRIFTLCIERDRDLLI